MKEKYYFNFEDIKDIDYQKEIGDPGEFPFVGEFIKQCIRENCGR